jgi:uncharacterized protein (DUF2141 family)
MFSSLETASRRVWVTAVALMVTVASTRAQEPTRISLSGEVRGASGAHTVRVALWSEAGFLEKPVEEVHFDAGRATRYTFLVPRGRWAISAYEDRNENGVLDMGLFGPREPNGFWRQFRGRHKPHFDEVAMPVDHDIADANIVLR